MGIPGEGNGRPEVFPGILVEVTRRPAEVVTAESPSAGGIGTQHIVCVCYPRRKLDLPAQPQIDNEVGPHYTRILNIGIVLRHAKIDVENSTIRRPGIDICVHVSMMT